VLFPAYLGRAYDAGEVAMTDTHIEVWEAGRTDKEEITDPAQLEPRDLMFPMGRGVSYGIGQQLPLWKVLDNRDICRVHDGETSQILDLQAWHWYRLPKKG
jgi:hypothetical protein